MKVKVENITIQMTTIEADMLCTLLHHVDWKQFHSDSSVVKNYQDFVVDFIDLVSVEIR